MDTLKSTKVDWKKLAVVGALVFLTAVTVGGLTWYVATAGAQDEMEAYKNDIVRLETEIKQLLSGTDEDDPAKSVATSNAYTNKNGKYSFTLPSGYIVSENIYGCEGLCGQQIGISKVLTGSKYQNLYLTIGYYVETNTPNLNEIVNGVEGYKDAYNKKDVKVAGVDAKYFELPGFGGNGRDYYFVKGDHVYHIEASDFNPSGQEVALNAILKSMTLN